MKFAVKFTREYKKEATLILEAESEEKLEEEIYDRKYDKRIGDAFKGALIKDAGYENYEIMEMKDEV